VTRDQIEDALGDYAFLLRWLPEFLDYGLPRRLAGLCDAPPPGPFDLTEEQLVDLIDDPLAMLGTIRDLVNQRIEWHVWNTYCQCDAAAMLPGADCYDAKALTLNPWMLHRLTETSGTTAVDEGTIGQDGVYEGAVTLAQAGPFADRVAPRFTTGAEEGAVEVRGHDTTGVGRVSLSAWIFPVSYHTAPSNLQVIQTWQSGTAAGALGMQLRIQASSSTAGTLRGLQYRVGGLTTEITGPSIPLNTWTHVVFTYDVAGFIHLAVNGVRSWTVSANQGSTGPHDAGRFYDISQRSNIWFDGRIYGAMVSPPLTSTQEADLYAAGVTTCELDYPPSGVDPLPAPEIPPSVELPPAPPACTEAQLCTDMTALLRTVTALGETVKVIQTQAAPFAYRTGETFTGLTGTGDVAVRATLGARVDITTLPSAYGAILANPTVLVDVGWISLATADGWLPAQRLQHDNLLLLPPVPGIITGIYYSLRPGVVASITTLERLR
jgi:hypothetical protein